MRRNTPKSQGPAIQGVYVNGDSSSLLRRHVALKPVKTTPVPFAIGFPWWLSDKNSPANAGDAGSIPGLERSPGGGYGNVLQYSCLENPMDRGAWQATVHGVTELDTTE